MRSECEASANKRIERETSTMRAEPTQSEREALQRSRTPRRSINKTRPSLVSILTRRDGLYCLFAQTLLLQLVRVADQLGFDLIAGR